MLNAYFKKVYYICDKVVVRTLRTRRTLGPNPGIDNRSKAFQKEGIPLDENAEDFIEESEGDFFKTETLYKQNIKDSKLAKNALRYKIVAQKYFRDQMPNLLTWSEKEQIRYLHSKEPDEWTPERLAESFPVTAEVVKKLIKYPWKPASMDRIARHDASAMRNWRELKEDTLDIPPELKEHFLKFSERTIPPLDKKSIKIDITPTHQEIGEFQAIVDRCAKNDQTNETLNKTNYEDGAENSTTENKNNNKYMRKHLTLEDLTSRIKNRLESGHEVSASDQLLLQNNLTKSEDLIELSNVNEITEIKEQNEKTAVQKMETGIVKLKSYPQRIRIPKKAFKKDATYKVDDCYYDYDGKFLYRVIGL